MPCGTEKLSPIACPAPWYGSCASQSLRMIIRPKIGLEAGEVGEPETEHCGTIYNKWPKYNKPHIFLS